jgi:hypothetical protein
MSETYSARQKVEWLARHTRKGYSVRIVNEPLPVVINRLGEGLMAPPGRSSSVDLLPRAHRSEAFVTGFIFGNSFSFTGYRARQWIPRALRLGSEPKARLVGSLGEVGQSTTITYRVDFAARSKIFFATMAAASALLIVGVATSLTLGWSIPGASFFSFLLAGVCVVFANDIWASIPGAVEDEAFLNDWFSRILDRDHPGRTDNC